jgi:DNA-directed RNA polymerase subunit RPC12/RpoP
MPHLACRTCGRRIYSVAPLSSMTADELRCPRCGARFQEDRRGAERRTTIRRENPSDDPRPPAAPTESEPEGTEGVTDDGTERRATNRRTGQRRGGKPPLPGAADDAGRWKD